GVAQCSAVWTSVSEWARVEPQGCPEATASGRTVEGATGNHIYLDPLELEALMCMDHSFFIPLIAPATREQVPHGPGCVVDKIVEGRAMPQEGADPVSFLHQVWELPEAKRSIEEALEQRLKGDDLSKHIQFQAEKAAGDAIRTHIEWRWRNLKRWYSFLVIAGGIAGLTVLGILAWSYTEFQSYFGKIKTSLHTIGEIPTVVLKTSAAFQRLHREQFDLAMASKRRWELDDHSEELDTLRKHAGPRMTTLLRLL